MTSSISSNIWLNLAGSEPDLYFPSIASATTGSCSPPEEVDPQLAVVQRFSQLTIGDKSLEKHDYNASESTDVIWGHSSELVDEDLFMPPRRLTEFLPLGSGTLQQCEQPRSRYHAERNSRDSNYGLAPRQHFEAPPRRVQSNIQLPTTGFGISADRPIASLSSAPSFDGFDTYSSGDKSLETLWNQAQQKQDQLMAALMLLQNDARHIHAEIDDLQSEQSEHSEDVAAAWQGKHRRFLPLN